MKDMDLDELHQAVNALMDDSKKPKAKKPAAVTNSSAKGPEPKKEEKPAAVSKSNDESVRVTVNRPRPQVPQRTRTRGAAMDIVQPRTSLKAAPPSARAARVAPTLTPTQPLTPEPPVSAKPAESPADVSDDVLASIDMQSPPAKSQSAPVADKPMPDKKDDQAWPDPLDFHDFVDDTKQKPKESQPAETTAPTVEQPAPTMASTPEEPTPSPFVTTKVEKRPLGAYATTPEPAQAESKEPTQPTPETQSPAQPIEPQPSTEKSEPKAPPTPQPEELSPEVVAVESAVSSVNVAVPAEPSTPDELRNMAIPPQYQTKEHQPSQDTRPIFDTKEYHAPAAPVHAAHRGGSIWSWVLIIMLVILLTTAGVLAYYVMTDNFDITTLL